MELAVSLESLAIKRDGANYGAIILAHHDGVHVLAFRVCSLGRARNLLSWPATQDAILGFAAFWRKHWSMRSLFIIFVLALITVAFEIYSDPQPTSATMTQAAADTTTTGIAHALKYQGEHR